MEQKEKISSYQLIWYLTIFSMVGLVVEMSYCYITTGVLESRQGLIWGPFCPIYGVGACILIYCLNRYQKNILKLFLYGTVLGGLIEYILSYLLEAIYGMRFWEYSYLTQNLNGRICLIYSAFWGILTLLLIKGFKPWIDELIAKIPTKLNRIITIAILVFFILNGICTIWAVKTYERRATSHFSGVTTIETDQNKEIRKIEEKMFSNEKMKKTFPNLRIIENGKEYFVRDLIE